jgi:mRNA-degrading endonuclease RelE of RelBE toxin-antitoxin system
MALMLNDENNPKVKLEYTAEFKRNIRQLAKKYRKIKTDLQELLQQLSIGDKPGDQIPDVVYEVFKVRVKNSDSAKGKRGGYRVIYQCKDDVVILITIYSKSEQEDISPQEIQTIILDYDSDVQSLAENKAEESVQLNNFSEKNTSETNNGS